MSTFNTGVIQLDGAVEENLLKGVSIQVVFELLPQCRIC